MGPTPMHEVVVIAVSVNQGTGLGCYEPGDWSLFHNYLFTGDANNPTAKSDLLLVAGGAGGGAYIRCVAGAGGGDSWTVGKRASDGDADVNYKNGTNVTFTGSQGGKGKDYNNNTGNQRGGSGGHGGGFKAVSILAGQQQTYAGCGGSGWGDTTKGQGYTTTEGGATAGGDGKVIITWYGTSYP